jgi:hypothetical protein
MSIELIPLFSVPVIKFKFSKHNKYTFPDIGKCENIPDGWELSLNSSFPNIEDNDSFIDSATRDSLENDLLIDIKKVLSTLKLSSSVFLKSLWYNIYHDNQGQEAHDHICGAGETNNYWSGIYYNKGSSPTTFHNAHKYMKLCRPPEVGEIMSEFYNDMHSAEVEDGDVILFPPWLVHEVIPDKKRKHMRLTFTFNVGYTE